ncbi:MAG: type II toxin-antitoxin system HicB family antitoxin [Candidatus Magnetobacterium sp. LHC-1]|uniref:Type II toxin-antitoxin system HicB family antitoxin n=1 Tax=Candidatus Magnetobacterium casense TaxID=1455061 RepID=A0ABS6RYL5_9BACT|nr:type II toxin-antitoxin system HicB family antitoxin [Candidatus Magnetobacterium casensis]MBF0608682.1 type II toxin-antitoxin system HicB family antitoxin [Nitrospirota bacterium]MBV6341745.1 type II toxin-antitoxin system HicB family antitoxin [Candidatus Magnetobacterium casensis]
MRKVIIYPGEDGYWVVECPSLPGCISQGRTRQDAIENIKEAIALYIEVLIDDERSIPEDQLEVLTV